jgi:hypothetical protein
MKIIVNLKNYTRFKYKKYFGGGTPENNPYVVGQVIVVKNDNRLDLAVVLGVMTPDDVRLDLCGMTPLEKVRPANISDFSNPEIGCPEKLLKECQGYKVDFNWETYELTIEEPIL